MGISNPGADTWKAMRYSPTDVTLYVPAFNAERTLDACVDGVRRLRDQPVEIIVVDDGSAQPVVVNHAGMRVIRHDTNRGLGAARNTAIKACETTLLAGVDADVVVDEHWLTELLRAMNGHDVVGVGGHMDEAHTETLADRWRARHMSQSWGGESKMNPRFLYGCNTLHKVAHLREVDGYDERYRRSFDDVSISAALYEAGHQLLYWPNATCQHLRRDTMQSVLRSFWSWHHPAGVARGDYCDESSLCARVERVSFGIGVYRFEIDSRDGCDDLLWLDAAIPWVFSACDLEYASTHNMLHGSRKLLKLAPEPIRQQLSELLKSDPQASDRYADQFVTCLQMTGWEQRMQDAGWARSAATAKL